MITRYTTRVNLDSKETTGFSLHVSQHTAYNGSNNLIDYTEKKLIRYAASIVDTQQRLVIIALIKDYISGLIAIAWKKGLPIYVRVTKNV